MILPEKYQGMADTELKKKISALKKKFGKKLVILGHHYQCDDVYNFADFTGDSLKLSRDAAGQREAEYIVFCGVHFMAEAARILCSEKQRVFLPDLEAGCPMAEMAALEDVEAAWGTIAKYVEVAKVVPVTYMNSTAEIKAFCGRNGGAVCTSSNAGKIFDWALGRGEKILFLPDEHLGRNTAREKGIGRGEVSLWRHEDVDGGLTKSEIERTKVFVWDGFCHVHTHFTMEHINDARKKYPDGKIIVHPECREEVVLMSDAAGSTEQIKQYVESSPTDSTVIVGTEINMVGRLAANNKDKRVVPLARSLCPNMFKISLGDLLWTLETLGSVCEVFVRSDVARDAKVALDRMLLPPRCQAPVSKSVTN